MSSGILAANTTSNYTVITPSDMDCLFEAAGTLINNPGTIPSETQDHLLESFLMPQISTIRTLLQQRQQRPGNHHNHHNHHEMPHHEMPIMIATIAMVLSTIASLSKGFSKADMDNPNIITPAFKSLFLQALQVSIISVQSLPTSLDVRSKSIMLVHRTILLLEDDVLPHVAGLLLPMISSCKKEDLQEVVQLMNQLMIKFQGKVGAAIDAVLPAFLGRYATLVPQAGEGSAAQIEAETLGVSKLYMLLLQHTVSNGCEGVLVSPNNISSFTSVLGMMLLGISAGDAPVKKSSLLFFAGLCKSCACDGDAVLRATFWNYVVKNVLVQAVQMMMDPVKFNVKDAQCSRVAAEAGGLLFCVLLRDPSGFGSFAASLATFVHAATGGGEEEGRGAGCAKALQAMRGSKSEANMKKALQQFLVAWGGSKK